MKSKLTTDRLMLREEAGQATAVASVCSLPSPLPAGDAGRDLYRPIPQYYDLEYADRTEDIGFYQRLAFEAGDPVLELGCGTGRLAIPLARTGSRVVGLDSDHGMLAVCQAKRDRLSGAIRGGLDLVQADLREFALGCEFRFIFAAFNTFLVLPALTDRDACLASVRRHLACDGRFVVDVFLPDPARLVQEGAGEVLERAFYWPAGKTTVMKYRRVRADVARQALDVELRYRYHDQAGRPGEDRYRFQMAVVFPNEMRLLLERHGFRVMEVYGSYDMEPLTRRSERMIFVSAKA